VFYVKKHCAKTIFYSVKPTPVSFIQLNASMLESDGKLQSMVLTA